MNMERAHVRICVVFRIGTSVTVLARAFRIWLCSFHYTTLTHQCAWVKVQRSVIEAHVAKVIRDVQVHARSL